MVSLATVDCPNVSMDSSGTEFVAIRFPTPPAERNCAEKMEITVEHSWNSFSF
jgi:hypothetical protein